MRVVFHCALTMGAAILGAVACAAAPSPVPQIQAKHLPRPEWPGVEPRTVVLRVEERREFPPPVESVETQKRVREAVAGALLEGHVQTADDSPNELTMGLEYPSEVPEGFGVEADCILVRAELTFSRGRAEAWSVGCYEKREIALASGADATDSFKNALRGAMQGIEKQLREFERSK